MHSVRFMMQYVIRNMRCVLGGPPKYTVPFKGPLSLTDWAAGSPSLLSACLYQGTWGICSVFVLSRSCRYWASAQSF